MRRICIECGRRTAGWWQAPDSTICERRATLGLVQRLPAAQLIVDSMPPAHRPQAQSVIDNAIRKLN